MPGVESSQKHENMVEMTPDYRSKTLSIQNTAESHLNSQILSDSIWKYLVHPGPDESTTLFKSLVQFPSDNKLPQIEKHLKIFLLKAI